MTTIPLSAVVVLSGGLDSTTALALYRQPQAAGYEVLALSVDYGQRHGPRELQAARDVAAHYGVEHLTVDLSGIGKALTGSALTDPTVQVPAGHYAESTMAATIVPNRNAVLANVAVAVAVARGYGQVVMGIHAGDHAVYPDCRPEFVQALQDLVDVANEDQGPPTIVAPFLSMGKAGIASIAGELGVPVGLTWSCYVGGDVHCGTCGTCYERREAFALAEVPDPTVYLDSTTTFPTPETTR